MAKAKTVAEVVAGEAVSGTPEERMADMRAIASVIANRAALLGVTPQEVIANSREFNAYNKGLPPGVDQDLVDLAQEQIDYVAENGPTTTATFYATPTATDNLPGGLSFETETAGHQFFSDPQSRAIGTSNGFVQPNEFAYAQNVENAPTPYAANDLTNNSLLSAFSSTPTYKDDPFSSLLGKPAAPVETWSSMAAAKPIQAPMGSVTASGLLGAPPSLEASAAAHPLLSVPATADLSTTPGLGADTAVRGLLDIATPSSRMGVAEPGFDASRFDGLGPSVATDFDPGRFASPTTTAFDASRFGAPTIDPATNVTSFMDQPAAPANIAGFSDAYAAQRGPTSGLLSADSQTVQGLAEKQLAEAARQVPSLSVPATGLLAANAPLEAQATVPSLASYAAPTAVTPAEQAIDNVTTSSTTPGLLSPTSIATANAPLTSSVTSPDLTGKSILGAQPVQQNAFVSSFPSAVANNQFEPATVNDVVAAPTLDTIQISEQPSVATVDGPANTPAVDQQQQAAVTTAAKTEVAKQATQPSLASRMAKVVNPGTVAGGLLGSLALGPAGGIIGGLLGNAVNQNGGLSGLLGSGFVSPTNQIAGGIANIGGIYGGAYAPGTFAVASNGAQITAQPGGYTSMITPSGQHEVISPTGQISHNFGSLFGGKPTEDAEAA